MRRHTYATSSLANVRDSSNRVCLRFRRYQYTQRLVLTFPRPSISTIIPSEALSTISSQARKAAHRYPVILDIPSTQLLDRVIPPPVEPVVRKTAPPLPINPIIAPRPTHALSPAQSLAKSLRLSSLFWIHPTVRRAVLGNLDSPLCQPPPKKRYRPASYIAPTKPLCSGGDHDNYARPKIVRNCSSPPAFEPERKEDLPRYVQVLARAG